MPEDLVPADTCLKPIMGQVQGLALVFRLNDLVRQYIENLFRFLDADPVHADTVRLCTVQGIIFGADIKGIFICLQDNEVFRLIMVVTADKPDFVPKA